jgi:hypothetical protein
MTSTTTLAERPTQQLPHEVVWELSNAIIASRALHVVAELGVADHIADEPTTVETLATACRVSVDGLDRAMQLLVSLGIFRHTDRGYGHTDASLPLRSDHPMSMRAFARLGGLPVCAAAYANLGYSVSTGRPAVECVDSQGFWHYLQEHPDEAAVFEQAMAAKAHADIAAVLRAYDFSPHRRVADVGGGQGHLLRAVLLSYPKISGVLFELPLVAARATRTKRLDVVAGDFFTDPLPACDAYLLMNIIHDWDDTAATAILTAVASAGRPSGATVLLVEALLPQTCESHWARTLDVVMLAVTGGRERTLAEYSRLLDAAGIDVVRAVTTDTAFSIVEGRVR